MKIRYITVLAAGLLSTFGALAQDLNPHVLVTNEYEGKIVEVSKKDIGMVVPDSLLKFNYDIDYSIFANPYNGSYEFHPYLVEMRPDATPYDGKSFYASLGAGYTLHPELDIVWNPKTEGKSCFGVYERYRGFFGNYGNLGIDELTPSSIHELDKEGCEGRYMTNRLALEGTWFLDKSILGFEAGYSFMHSKDSLTTHLVHGGDVTLRLRSSPVMKTSFFYDFSLALAGMHDNLQYDSSITVTDLGGKLFGDFGFKLGTRHALICDVETGYYNDKGLFNGSMFGIAATPKYLFDYENFRCTLGAKISYATGGFRQIIYPDVYLDLFFADRKADFYVKVVGGDKIQTYGDFLKLNPFAGEYNIPGQAFEMGVETERFNASIGLRGSLGQHFQYDVFAGYAMKSSVLSESLIYLTLPALDHGILLPYFSRCDYNQMQAGADLFWSSRRFALDCKLRYTDVDAIRRGCSIVAPAKFKGELEATYNINERIYFGIDLTSETERAVNCEAVIVQTKQLTIPWYLDLGAHAEFKINRWLSAWAKGGNFLNQPVQKYLLHAERGPYFVAGIRVNL